MAYPWLTNPLFDMNKGFPVDILNLIARSTRGWENLQTLEDKKKSCLTRELNLRVCDTSELCTWVCPNFFRLASQVAQEEASESALKLDRAESNQSAERELEEAKIYTEDFGRNTSANLPRSNTTEQAATSSSSQNSHATQVLDLDIRFKIKYVRFDGDSEWFIPLAIYWQLTLLPQFVTICKDHFQIR